MRAFVLVLSLVLLPKLAVAQASPTGDPVTVGDLNGATIEATVTMQRVVLRDGREFPASFQSDLRLVFGPDNTLTGSLTSTASSARGVRKGKPQTFTPKLEAPKEIKLSGGGHAVWFFDKSTLTHLRTFKGGAYKRDIAFVRSAGALACTIQETFAREDGFSSLEMNSPIDNAPMRVVSSKSCRVVERNK